MSAASALYWAAVCHRAWGACLILLVPLLLLVTLTMHALTDRAVCDEGRAWCMRWLWLFVLLTLADLAALVLLPSESTVAAMALQRAKETGAALAPETERTLRGMCRGKEGECATRRDSPRTR